MRVNDCGADGNSGAQYLIGIGQSIVTIEVTLDFIETEEVRHRRHYRMGLTKTDRNYQASGKAPS